MRHGKTAKPPVRAASPAALKMEEQLTSVIIKVPGGYIGLVEEVPGAFTQGASVEEVRENLVEVVRLMIQTQREAAQKEVAEENHEEVRKEPIGRILI
ncbi:MAG: type II toxin-antitoxin system HicB family antitoxin [Gammaproteobacteria bacterium]|nr:type II toxin-antitoxin system HicB family antitoxin [Gammaproteobacteria bacterium]